MVKLITDTLERSSEVPDGTVAAEVAALEGMGPSLIAAGHLETSGLVLVDEDLHLTITVVTGDRALEVDENLNPVPGGARATEEWMLYLPCPDPLTSALSQAVGTSDHLSIEAPPTSAPRRTAKSVSGGDGVLDLEAIRDRDNRP